MQSKLSNVLPLALALYGMSLRIQPTRWLGLWWYALIGVFLIKYKIELLLSFPFFAVLFTWYLGISLKADSAAQAPEKLYREGAFMSFAALRYVVVGGTALAIHLMVLQLLLRMHACAPWMASAFGFIVARLLNYTLQRLWVFRSDRSHATALPRYVAITGVMMAVNTAAFAMLFACGLPPLPAQTLTTGGVFVLNFFANCRFTFGAKHLVAQ